MVKKQETDYIKKEFFFVTIYNKLVKEDFLEPETLSLSTPFVKKRQNIIFRTLYSFSGPFQALQADIAYISF